MWSKTLFLQEFVSDVRHSDSFVQIIWKVSPAFLEFVMLLSALCVLELIMYNTVFVIISSSRSQSLKRPAVGAGLPFGLRDHCGMVECPGVGLGRRRNWCNVIGFNLQLVQLISSVISVSDFKALFFFWAF